MRQESTRSRRGPAAPAPGWGLALGLFCCAIVAAGAWTSAARGQDEEVADPGAGGETRLRFVEGLRRLGYFDLAQDYLEGLRNDPEAPADLRETIDFEQGKTFLEEITRIADLERQRDLLEKARVKLLTFSREKPNHPVAPAARAQFARLMIQRGELAVYQADDSTDPEDKEAKLVQARESFDQARTALDEAIGQLQAAYDKMPKGYLDPKAPEKRLRDSLHAELMLAEFQRATVDYTDGHTYSPEDHPTRRELLDKALERFKALSAKYRTQSIGLYAKMWEGKCYEESGRIGEAMGIFNQIVENSDRRLDDLKRQVKYFRIIASRKRGEIALAADDAARWLAEYPRYANTVIGLGVALERARNMHLQLEKDTSIPRPERDAAARVIRDTLRSVVRTYSPHKAEALELLKRYDTKSALRAEDVAKMTYDEAIANAEASINEGNMPEALTALRHAMNRAFAEMPRNPTPDDRNRAADKANRARYLMAYAHYANGDFYESAALSEFLARQYPTGGLSAKATEIGMAAYVGAYNATQVDRGADIRRLVDLATYTAETFKGQDQGNAGLMMLGQIEHGRGNYAEAVRAFDAVEPTSARRTEALTSAGNAHWRLARKLRAEGRDEDAAREEGPAEAKLREAYNRRMEANAPSTDPARIDNACLLADVLMGVGKPAEALEVVAPLAQQLNAAPIPATLKPKHVQVMTTLLLANIQNGRTDQAIADIEVLEKSGTDNETMVQLYYRLGRLLEQDLERLREAGDATGADKARSDFSRFLDSLVRSESGRTFEAMQWAGESKLKLGEAAEAADILAKVKEEQEKLKNETTDIQLMGEIDKRMPRIQLQLAAALREAGKYSEAAAELSTLLGRQPPLMEAMFEECRLETAKAAANRGNWNAALGKWVNLTKQLGTLRPRPDEYFQAFYELSEAYLAKGDRENARKTLNGILKLNRRGMSAEFQEKYNAMLRSIEAGG